MFVVYLCEKIGYNLYKGHENKYLCVYGIYLNIPWEGELLMKVHICKTKKDLIMDNFNMIFSGKRKYFFGGAVIIGLVLSFMGKSEGLIILTFSLVLLSISALSIFSILRKIKGDKLELTYELDGKVLKVQNPMGIINVNTLDIGTIEDNKDFYLLEIKNTDGRNTKLPLYRTGVVEGEIDALINNIRVELNKEYEEEENIKVVQEIKEEKSLDSVEDNDNSEEKDMNEMEANEKREEDIENIGIEDKNEIESIQNEEETKVSEIEEKAIEQSEIEEKDVQSDKVDTYEIRNIVRFQNKFRNDFKRSLYR